MLLQCDICQNVFSELSKIPCGFFIERNANGVFFIMPNDEEAYRNICLRCLLQQHGNEDIEEHEEDT